jgi:ApbE superfamily uncharacterized protein (UPF0280 family)
MYKKRFYRKWVRSDDLVNFEVIEKETDLLISAEKDLRGMAREAVLEYRGEIERYIKVKPRFYKSLEPVDVGDRAPRIVKAMARAAKKAGVGPMAAVAGAIAEFVGRRLLGSSSQVVVENGGDLFMKTSKPRTIAVYAGEKSPFTSKLAIEVGPASDGLGISTSSGTVSHSLSFGNADAALVIADDASLADAMATAVGNIVKSPTDIEKGIAFAKSVAGIRGVLIAVKERLGSWGDIKLLTGLE